MDNKQVKLDSGAKRLNQRRAATKPRQTSATMKIDPKTVKARIAEAKTRAEAKRATRAQNQATAAARIKKAPAETSETKPQIRVASNTRRDEVIRAQRMVSSDISLRSSQHLISTPVNKSEFNGNHGQQVSQTALRQARFNPKAVRIIPLGGLGEIGIGKNMTLIEYHNEMILIDMGSIFPNEDYPGVSYMAADISYVKENIHKLKAIMFTHAHLDHIGACQLLLPQLADGGHVPIYATDFTIEMIKKQMEEVPGEFNLNYNVVDPHQHQQIKVSQNLSFEFIHVAHSIPGCVAIVVRTPNGIVLHSGDWRFEKEPVEKPFDMPRLVEISQKEGIDLFLNESTNIDVPGTHASTELEIGENIGKVMDLNPNGRVILSCFSSQIYRIQFILEQAKAHGRKVAFAGFSMINTVETALRTKKIKIPKDTIVKIEDISRMPDNQITIICTGSQGELNAVLNKMITGAHRHIKIKPTDTVVFSSNPIPGNEPRVTSTIDGLLREGSHVIQHRRNHLNNIGDLHLSGHAYYEDHVLMLKSIKPRNYMPIHGQFFMLQHNAEMAYNVIGLKKENIVVCDNGDVVELLPDKTIQKNGRVYVNSIIYDNANNPIHEAVIKDRLHISTEGIVIVVLMINKKTGRIAKTPDIISRAFVYLKDNEELMSRVRHYLKIKIEKTDLNSVDIKDLKTEIKDDVTHILFDSTKQTPVVIPVINLF